MTTADRVLVVGGTGPTGVPLVQGLVDRGHHVTILHRGTHEDPETPTEVEHLHADPYDADSFRAALGARRLRPLDRDVRPAARHRRGAGRSHRPVRLGRRRPGLPRVHEPVPDRPSRAARARSPSRPRWSGRPRTTRRAIASSAPRRPCSRPTPTATHFRYPYVYGPRQLVPREWCIVRRVLDGRERIVVADEGLTLHHHAFTENCAHALLLAVDRPDAAAGPDLQRRRRGGADDPPGDRPRGRRARPPVRDRVDAVRSGRAGPPAADAAAAHPPGARPHGHPHPPRLPRRRPGPRGPGPHGAVAGRPPARAGWHRGEDPDRPVRLRRRGPAHRRLAGRRAIGARCRRSPIEPRYGLAYSGPGGRPRSQEVFEP